MQLSSVAMALRPFLRAMVILPSVLAVITRASDGRDPMSRSSAAILPSGSVMVQERFAINRRGGAVDHHVESLSYGYSYHEPFGYYHDPVQELLQKQYLASRKQAHFSAALAKAGSPVGA